MKKNFTSPFKVLLFILALLTSQVKVFGQATIWSEDFSVSPCTSLCPADGYAGKTGTWTTMSTGAQGTTPNIWYVSGAENRGAVGSCGEQGTNNTLHIGNVAGSSTAEFFCKDGDCGADYDAGGGSGGSIYTHTRAVSPTINLTGRSNVSFSFNYIEGGDGVSDNMTIEYSIDGGTSWAFLADPPTTKNTGCPLVKGLKKGKWTNYTVQLPASANNNPNFKLGFNWVNESGNDDDPSAAVAGASVTTKNDGDFNSITETELSGSIEIFPNPFMNNFTLSVNSSLQQGTALIYDVLGNEIRSVKLAANQSSSVNTSGMSRGVYMVKIISSDGNVAFRKLVKE